MIQLWWQSLSSILLLTLSIHYMYTHMFIITIQVMKNKPFNHKGIEKQKTQNIFTFFRKLKLYCLRFFSHQNKRFTDS